jgi:hypothetical protein
MILDTQASYPHSQTYVLKLHRNAAPADGRIVGRLEHVASGHQFPFNTWDELIACLIIGAALGAAPQPER